VGVGGGYGEVAVAGVGLGEDAVGLGDETAGLGEPVVPEGVVGLGDGVTPASSGWACVRVIVEVGFLSPKPLTVMSSQATRRLVVLSK
jgi:hypothetical protein